MKKSRLRRLTIVSIAVLSMVLVYSLVHSWAQSSPRRTRVIELVEPAGVPFTNENGAAPEGLFIIQENFFVSFNFRVSKLGWICGPARWIPGDLTRMFYTIYVETPSLGRFRVYNFSTGCNFGNFQASFTTFPPGTPKNFLFEEPITIDIDLEADDNLDLNIFPFADYVLSGQD